jgi:parallel beta-helix repeat protein
VFGNKIIHGDGVTDDTAGIQAALKTSDVIVAPATYAIAGNVTIPTGRNISCQSGAIFFDTQSKGTRMFQIGWGNPASNGNNSIVGCTFQGTDTAANYSTYAGGTSGYSELLMISTGNGQHTDNVLIENNTFLNGQGDNIITFSPCGPNNTGAPCNGGAPGTEGPSHIFIVNNNISHCGQPGIHLNGGQNIVVTGNTVTDCNADNEVDGFALQVIQSWWYNNVYTTSLGTFDALRGQIVGPYHSCTGDYFLAEDDSRCYQYNELITGSTSYGASTLGEPVQGTCPGAFIPGHYINQSLTNGAVLNTGC